MQVPVELKAPVDLEREVLAFWKEKEIFARCLEASEGRPEFVFYEGPPTANGTPHNGHVLTRAIKDLFPRYRTMKGFLCERKGGWDTHGLPVEVEVCKELGIHSKEEIEAFGVEPFIHKCQESVWRYMQEWERLTERLGFWIHLDDAYVTYEQSYVESVWWSLQNLFDRGLLYQGYKIVWWWAQGGTALSAGEVGQGYREVADPSVYVRFPLCEKPETSLLVWTTTPWTLPSNQFVAVNPELEYATVEEEETGDRLILAASLVETVAEKKKQTLQVVETCPGSELLGQRYRPPFDYYYQQDGETTGTLQFTPLADQYGTTTITVTVEDGGLDKDLATTEDNATTTQTFDVTVNPVNDDPTLVQPDNLTIDEDASEQTVDLTGITAGGGEIQPLRVTATSSDPSLVTAATSRTFSGTLTDGLFAYYSFDGSTNDVSGNDRHATADGTIAITTDRFGNADSAYQIEPRGSINVSPQDSLFPYAGSDTVTYSLWAKPTSDAIVLSQYLHLNAGASHFFFAVDGDSERFTLTGQGTDVFQPAAVNPYNQWHHYVMSYNGQVYFRVLISKFQVCHLRIKEIWKVPFVQHFIETFYFNEYQF